MQITGCREIFRMAETGSGGGAADGGVKPAAADEKGDTSGRAEALPAEDGAAQTALPEAEAEGEGVRGAETEPADNMQDSAESGKRASRTPLGDALARRMLSWRQQEAALRTVLPEFSLDAEMETSGGRMLRLLEGGASVEEAYKALHLDELLQSAVAGAVRRTRQRVLEEIAARGARPPENGAGASAQHAGVDVGAISPAKARELERRCARGERITPDKMMS